MFSGFTNLPTPMTTRVYVNLLEGHLMQVYDLYILSVNPMNIPWNSPLLTIKSPFIVTIYSG